MKKLLFLFLALAAQSALAQWEPCMPDIIGSPITALHFNTTGIFVGTAAGVSRSTDAGDKWVWNKLHREGWAQSFFENGGKIFVGTRHGAYASTDNGTRWDYVEIGDSLNWAFGFANIGDKLFAATLKGVYLSTDAGASWGQKLADFNMNTFCQINSIGDKLLITSRNNGNYYSEDEGKTWSQVADTLPFTAVSKRDGKIYGLTYNGLYVSEDAGRNYQLLDTLTPGPYADIAVGDGKALIGYPSGVMIYNIAAKTWESAKVNSEKITKVGIDGETYYAAGERDLYRSTDYGKTWFCPRPTIIARKTFTLIRSDKELLAGNDQGLFGSADSGKTWVRKNPTMENSIVFRAATRGNTIAATLGSAADTVIVSEDGGSTWLRVADIFAGASDQSINNVGLDDKNIYIAATSKFGISSDRGKTWRTVNELEGRDFYNIAVKGDSVWIKGLQREVFLSTDKGLNWKPMDDSLPFTDSYKIETGADKVAFLTKDALYIYKDGDTTWQRKQLPVNAIYKFKMKGDTIMIGLYGGILLSIDNGNSWKEVGSGYFDTEIMDMAIDDSYVYAATSNGIFKARIADLKLTGVAETRISDNQLAFYPNPAGDFINISASPEDIKRAENISIYDMLGNSVKVIPVKGSLNLSIELTGLPCGIYFLRIGEKTGSFVKE